MCRILITGASGYIGRTILEKLVKEGYAVNVVTRRRFAVPSGDVRVFHVQGISGDTDWRPALLGCSRVIHLAGQIPENNQTDQEFYDINDRGTARLVECVLASEVEQVILASSLAAVGGHQSDYMINENMVPHPSTAYGRSKLAAEKHLDVLTRTGRSGISLRLPSVYSGSAVGNWERIMSLAASRLPLPFGSIHNRRTLLSVINFESSLMSVIRHPVSCEQSGVYFVGDGTDVSLRDVLTWLRQGMGRAPLLVPIPATLISSLLALLGQRQLSASLLGNLEIDCTKFANTFNWKAPIQTSEAFMLAGAEFIKQNYDND